MTPKQRAIAALTLNKPDQVPTFELEFQLNQELFGEDPQDLQGLDDAALDKAVSFNAQLLLRAAERLEYSIIRSHDPRILRRLKEMGAGEEYLLCGEADGTMAIPDGSSMEDLALRLVEEPEDIHAELKRAAAWAKDFGAECIDAGAELLTMCSDYCFNTGPFLSPRQFSEFVTPYLAEVIAAHRRHGALVIKHTDGNIMPILDQLASAEPHGIHSLDPQGSVDIAEVVRLYGDRLCLCGNVNCALMQTGTLDEIRQSAEYALDHGMKAAGYIFCTSNVAFKGMELDRYLFILDIWKSRRAYSA